MRELKYGSVTITLPEEFTLLEQAGKLDAVDVSRVVKAPPGLGQACFHAAESIEKAQGKFMPPPGVTPETLREAGQKAEKVDQIIQDLEAAKVYLRQSGLLYKEHAYELLRMTNDAVKSQGKYNRECYTLFALLRSFFKKLANRTAPVVEETPPEDPAGWTMTAQSEGGSWSRESRPRNDKHPTEPKQRWEAIL